MFNATKLGFLKIFGVNSNQTSTSESIDYSQLFMFNATKLGFLKIFGVNSNQTFISQILKFSVPSEK